MFSSLGDRYAQNKWTSDFLNASSRPLKRFLKLMTPLRDR
jgi:hypothetical protein